MKEITAKRKPNRDTTEQEITGDIFKFIRKYGGYTAREFADYSYMHGGAFRTERSVYNLESYSTHVRSRYVEHLRELVGAHNFALALRKYIEEQETRQKNREEAKQRWLEAQAQQQQLKKNVYEFIVASGEKGCSAEDVLQQFPDVEWYKIKGLLSELRDAGKAIGRLYKVSRWYSTTTENLE